jgi:hypothetical protein
VRFVWSTLLPITTTEAPRMRTEWPWPHPFRVTRDLTRSRRRRRQPQHVRPGVRRCASRWASALSPSRSAATTSDVSPRVRSVRPYRESERLSNIATHQTPASLNCAAPTRHPPFGSAERSTRPPIAETQYLN